MDNEGFPVLESPSSRRAPNTKPGRKRRAERPVEAPPSAGLTERSIFREPWWLDAATDGNWDSRRGQEPQRAGAHNAASRPRDVEGRDSHVAVEGNGREARQDLSVQAVSRQPVSRVGMRKPDRP